MLWVWTGLWVHVQALDCLLINTPLFINDGINKAIIIEEKICGIVEEEAGLIKKIPPAKKKSFYHASCSSGGVLSSVKVERKVCKWKEQRKWLN